MRTTHHILTALVFLLSVFVTSAQGFDDPGTLHLGELVTLPSGLRYEILSDGEGERPGSSDTVVVHYQGSLVDGTVFDSSYDRGRPSELPLPRLIDGWREALPLMTVGSRWRLVIPPDLAYGTRGTRGVGPDATLIYEVELIDVRRRAGDHAAPIAEEPRVSGIRFSFKLDPRLTHSLYMGDRWVSPASYTRVGDESGLRVEARTSGLDESGRPVVLEPRWLSLDPETVAISPENGREVVISVLREGEVEVIVTVGEVSRTIAVTATRRHGVLQAEIRQ